jgi:hypothetical protein
MTRFTVAASGSGWSVDGAASGVDRRAGRRTLGRNGLAMLKIVDCRGAGVNHQVPAQ